MSDYTQCGVQSNWTPNQVGETLRAALNSLAVVAPTWVQAFAPPEWYDRYAHRVENYQLPKTDAAR